MEVTTVDGEGNTIVCLERKSVQPFKSQDEYLYAMKEDLAEWFNTLYSTNVTVDDFIEYLETGVVLCQHANKVNEYIIEQLESGQQPRQWDKEALQLAKQVIQYKTNVKPGSFQCRDNISNYISWCKWTLGIPDTLLFESDDLVMRKNERNVVLCVLEVARRGARFGMLAPCLVQLEQEIDAEIAGEEPPARVEIQRPRRTIDMMSLDEMVREIAKECTCPDQFPIIRVSEGKYKVGESLTLIFVRILRNHVMVRIGGGWDTLENYLNRHDPCRCDANKSQHKTRRYSQTAAKRRSSMTSPIPQSYADNMKPRKLPATPNTGMTVNSETIRRNSSVTSRDVERLRNSDSGRGTQSARGATSRPQSPSLAGRTQSPSAQDSSSRRPQSPKTFKRPSIQSAQAEYKPETVRSQPKRPASAGPTAPQNLRTLRKYERSREQPTGSESSRSVKKNDDRGRSASRNPSTTARHVRSRSVGAEEMLRSASKAASGYDVILVSRDKSGRHVINASGGTGTLSNVTVPITNGNGSGNGVGDTERRPNSARLKISAEKLLPSKPKAVMRSQSVETRSPTDPTDSGSSRSIGSDVASERPAFRRQASLTSLGPTPDFDDMPVPVGDHKLNKEMEKLFEEYRAAEKGWLHCDDEADEEVNMLSASASGTKFAPGGTGSAPGGSVSRRDTPVTNRSLGRKTPTTPGTNRSAGRNTPDPPGTNQSGGRKTPGTSQTRVRPVTPTLRTGAGLTAPPSDNAAAKSSHTSATWRRESSAKSATTGTRRSQTPNPTATAAQVRTPARCRTPLVNARSDDVIKPRTDTGLRKRPTTPSSGSRIEDTAQRSGRVTRSSSLSRVAINKQLTSNAGVEKLSAKRRSRSKDDILDDDGCGERRSRTDSIRRRDAAKPEHGSSSVHVEPSNGLIRALREPPRSLPATPNSATRAPPAGDPDGPSMLTGTPPTTDPMIVHIPADATNSVDRPTTRIAARPRKDDYTKPRTRIPRPSSARSYRSQTPEAGSLKRFDSGVDINVSPTENNSVQGDEDLCHQWQPPEAMTLTGHPLGYTAAISDGSDDYY